MLTEDFMLDIDDNFIILDNSMLYKENTVKYFFSNIYYVLSNDVSITYCVPVYEYKLENTIELAERNYDFLIDKNEELLQTLTLPYRFPPLNSDRYLSNIYQYDRYSKWYYNYFKNNVDLLNLVNMFVIIQNVPIRYYIGFEQNTQQFIKKMKNYLTMLFGKYNVDFNVLIFYDLFYDCLINQRKYISLDDLSSLFYNYKIEISFIDELFENEKYKISLFLQKNGVVYFIMNELTLMALLIFYYCKTYLFKIYNLILNNNKTYDHLIYDIILIKQVFFNSFCALKINEYLSAGILMYHAQTFNKLKQSEWLINNLRYDIVADNEFSIKKYVKEIVNTNDVIKLIQDKYKVKIT